MKTEMTSRDIIHRDEPPTEEEILFLDAIPDYQWTSEEIEELNKPTTLEEIRNNLDTEVDLDSSPGEDGITYRCLRTFITNNYFAQIYLGYLNDSRLKSTEETQDRITGENIGVMVIKDKKSKSIDYEKKRKLTKINKDTNLGNSKVWSNRLKNIVLPKILPKTQYNCQKDQHMVDEVMEIRDINLHLLGDTRNLEKDGTILSIDFSNAFRSTSLRWFNLVMKKLNLPEMFIDWFWKMYQILKLW